MRIKHFLEESAALIGLIVFTLSLFAFAAAVEACSAFYKYDRIDGMNRICTYNHLGSDYVTTIKSYNICPTSITVKH